MMTPGTSVSHYRILEELGHGGMGVVYRARDERLNRDVALKVLPAGMLADETARSRFRREALTLSQLNHPNIAVIHDFDCENGFDFLALEFVDGQTLAAKLAGGPLPEKEVTALGSQIAEALEEAHEHGIIHRDLKPANVIVTTKGRAKVLDFGLAKLAKPAEILEATASLAETQAGAVMGTVPYMAPEQLQGQAVDARADVYALGVVLYEMATGRRPFPQKQASQLIAAILTQPPDSPRELNGRISPGLEAVIQRSLERSPDRRYQSAKEVLEGLARLSLPGSVVGARSPATPGRWVLAVAAMAGLIAALAILAGLDVGGLRARLLGRGAQIHSLAVLPLENLSGDREQEYFADGMTEELITRLGKISALRVISRTSVMRYKRTDKSLTNIANELHVDAVIEGSVLRVGNRVRITAQLIEAASDRHLWAESYERDLRDVLALQSDVAQAITNEIKIQLTPQERTRLASAPAVNTAAYEAYLKGRYEWNKRTEEGLRKGIEFFREAIALEPSYALAYDGLADCYSLLAYYGYITPKEGYPNAEAAARKALEIDDSLAEAHTSLVFVKTFYDWDWPGAERESLRAIELNPKYATAHQWYGDALLSMGRVDEAVAEEKRALELDPLSLVINRDLGDALFLARQYDQAIAQYRKTLQLDPNFITVHGDLGAAYLQKSMYKEGIAEYQRELAISPGNPSALAGLGHAYAVTGRRAEAQQVLEQLNRLAKNRYLSPLSRVGIYLALGDKDRTFEWLEKSYEDRSIGVLELKTDRDYDPLRSDPRFQNLLRRMNLPL